MDDLGVAPSIPDVDTNHADMRIEVVKREINQGALAGFDSEISDYAAHLIITALDSYDEAALHKAYQLGYYDGFEAGQKRLPD